MSDTKIDLYGVDIEGTEEEVELLKQVLEIQGSPIYNIDLRGSRTDENGVRIVKRCISLASDDDPIAAQIVLREWALSHEHAQYEYWEPEISEI